MFKVLNDLVPNYLSRLIDKKSYNKGHQSTALYEDQSSAKHLKLSIHLLHEQGQELGSAHQMI